MHSPYRLCTYRMRVYVCNNVLNQTDSLDISEVWSVTTVMTTRALPLNSAICSRWTLSTTKDVKKNLTKGVSYGFMHVGLNNLFTKKLSSKLKNSKISTKDTCMPPERDTFNTYLRCKHRGTPKGYLENVF